MNNFLIQVAGGSKEVPLLERFTHFIGGSQNEFVIHMHQETRRLSQYRTGYMIADNAPDSVSGCRSLLEHLQRQYGLKRMKQSLNEMPTLNPQPRNTMSLEQALQANTAAIEALTAVLLKAPAPTTGATTAVVSEPLKATGDKPKEETAAARKARLTEEKAAFDLAAAEKAEKSKKTEEPAIDFKAAVTPLIIKISADKGRDSAIAFLSRFGVKKSSELKPDQFAEVIEKATAFLAGTYDPEAGTAKEEEDI